MYLNLWGTDTRLVRGPAISYHPAPCSSRSSTRSSDAFFC
jgi:hypothetical protein